MTVFLYMSEYKRWQAVNFTVLIQYVSLILPF